MIDKLRLGGFADEASDSIEGQCRVLKALCWSNIELRAVNGKQIADLSEDEFQHVLETLNENGISVMSLGSNIANWGQSILSPAEETEKLVEKTMPRAKKLKAKFIRIMSYSILTDKEGRVLSDQMEEERFRRLRYITDAFLDNGITPVHENYFTYGGLSWEHTEKLIENVPGLKLVFDTGNPPIDIDVRTGFPYKYQSFWEFYENVREHIAHVHIKDSFKSADGAEHYTYPGDGHGDVLRIVRDLENNGYTGFYSMEPHMAVVFHNSSIHATEEDRSSNFYEYGKRFMKLTDSIA